MSKARVIIIVFLIFASIITCLIAYNSLNRSEGNRGGSIVKLSRKGVVFKTWEGQFFVGSGMVVGEESVSLNNNIWEFSVVDDDTLIDKLKYYIGKGTRVSLEYHEKYTKLPWRGDTKYIVIGVKEYR